MMRALLLVALAAAATIKVGDKIPSVVLHHGFPPDLIDISERVASRKVVLVGLPGAFTPTWSNRQVPGYRQDADKFKDLGVDEVIIYCVNDGAVMEGWAKDQGVAGSEYITLMGDTTGELTKKLGMVLDHPGPNGLFGTSTPRSKRFAMYLVDGVAKIVRVAEGPGPKGEEDPAGDDYPEVTLAPAMLDAISAFNSAKSEL